MFGSCRTLWRDSNYQENEVARLIIISIHQLLMRLIKEMDPCHGGFQGDPVVWEVKVMVPAGVSCLFQFKERGGTKKTSIYGLMWCWFKCRFHLLSCRIKNLMVANIYHARGKMVQVDFSLGCKESLARTRKWNRLPNMIPSPQFAGIL